jgi:hypothetical protein
MISNTDSTLLVYPTKHILVKAYKRGVQAAVSGGVGDGPFRIGASGALGVAAAAALRGTIGGSRAEGVPFHGSGAWMAFDANDATSHDELQRHAIVQAHGPIA